MAIEPLTDAPYAAVTVHGSRGEQMRRVASARTRDRSTGAAGLVLALVWSAGACVRPPASEFTLPSLGPSVEQRLASADGPVPGIAVASVPPVVIVAWSTAAGSVHVAASADNGQTFAAPRAVSSADTRGVSADVALQVVASTNEGAGPAGIGSEPAFVVRWRGGHLSRTFQRGVRVARDGTSELRPVESVDPQAPAVRCARDGTVEWLPGEAVSAVAVNHGLSDQACVSSEVAAIRDWRGWVHVVWVGGAAAGAARHVFYAASTGREAWFGRAQRLDPEGTGEPSQVRLTTDPNDTVVATWTAGRPPASRVVMRQLLPAHHGPPQLLSLTTIADDGASRIGTPTAIRGGVLIAWARDAGPGTHLVFRRVGLDAVCGPAASPTVVSIDESAEDTHATPAFGAELYAENGCATCHGVDGHGDGPVGQTLTPAPRDFRDASAFKAGRDVTAIARTIADGFNQGGSKMPAFGHLSEQERRSLALFVISLRDRSPERTHP